MFQTGPLSAYHRIVVSGLAVNALLVVSGFSFSIGSAHTQLSQMQRTLTRQHAHLKILDHEYNNLDQRIADLSQWVRDHGGTTYGGN